MAYKRQISYLDLIENGLKKGNAGFCKWEYRGGFHSLSVSVNGLSGNLSEKARVFMEQEHLLGELDIRGGRAQANFSLQKFAGSDFHGPGIIRILLSQGRVLNAEFDVKRAEIERKTLDAVQKERVDVVEPLVVETPVIEPEAEEVQTDVVLQSTDESKSLWEKLGDTHAVIRPFGTETEYYRIALEDIYLLREEYHMLRNNPFLLHGYYNYRYLILGKKDRKDNEFWLGVPGIYHEREKMAARMYGFEKFEGTKPEYRAGDLGYYLISAM